MKFDIVAKDARGRDVLLVEVRASELDDEMAGSILDYIREAQLSVRFGMLVDLSRIRIVDYSRDAGNFACVLSSADVLREYDAGFGGSRIFHNYLRALAEAWIRDFTYHWKSERPPGFDQLMSIGLAQSLEGGTTRNEVGIETTSLH